MAGNRLLQAGRNIDRLLETQCKLSHTRIEFTPRYEPRTAVRQLLEHLFSIGVDRGSARLGSIQRNTREYAWTSMPEAVKRVRSWSNRDAIAAVARTTPLEHMTIL